MIKQLEYSESVGVPRDQKTAHAALRMFGYFLVEEAAKQQPTKPERTAGQALDEIFRGE